MGDVLTQRDTLRPPFPYYGAKTSLAEQIVAHLPEHDHYVEPFAGSLAVLLAKQPSKLETVNDLDHDLVTFWRVLRSEPEALVAACAMTPHSRDEFIRARDLDTAESDLERARRVWTLLAQGRTGSLRKTGWRSQRSTVGRHMSVPGEMNVQLDRMLDVAQRLSGVTLECRDALDVIRDFGEHSDVLIYADPPYLGTTRSTGYRHEMETEDAHRTLATALRNCCATVVLSGYHSPLYDDLYAGWHVHEIATWTGQGGEKASRTEVMWSNRPLRNVTEDLFSGAESA